MRELCREDYTFDGPSVIYPGTSVRTCTCFLPSTNCSQLLRKFSRQSKKCEHYFCSHVYFLLAFTIILSGKRLFVNRHKRIKALKLAGIAVYPQRNKPPPQDESSRDSTTR